MANISIDQMLIEGFRSFTSQAMICFTPNPGLKFLGGINELEPRLGANGAGKSSLWDALCWCFYGQTVRGLKASEVVSWGHKRPRVAAYVIIDGESFVIERYGSPNILTLEGEPIEQAELENILGLSRARFCQSVIFGQAAHLFLDLSVAERGNLLDEVLDLGIWQKAADCAGEEMKEHKRQVAELDRSLQFLRGRLSALPDVSALREQERAWELQLNKTINELFAQVEEYETRLNKARQAGPDMDLTYLSLDLDVTKARERLESATLELREMEKQLYVAETARNLAKDQLSSGICPTCGQATRGAQALDEIGYALAEHEAVVTKLLRSVARRTTDVDNATAAFAEASRLAGAARAKYDAETGALAQLNVDLERVAAEAEKTLEAINPYGEKINAVEEQHKEMTQDLNIGEQDKATLDGKVLEYDYWRQHFKGVRLFQVNQILTQLEIEVGNAASVLGLTGWQIGFVTETETKGGSVLKGVRVKVTSPQASGSWEAWSGGEGQRIRIAVAIGLASLIQAMAGMSYGFEVWDEPSAWLSAEGIDDLLDCLKYRASMTGKAVWIVDHRALSHSGFSEIWQVRKTAEGSQVELLQQSLSEG